MAIFATSGKSSKKTTPRGSGGIFSSNSHQQQQQQQQQQQHQHQQHQQQQQQHQQQQTYTVPVQRSLSNGSFNAAAFAPEKTGDSISPGLRLSSMETSNKPPTGRYAGKGCLLDQKPESMVAESLRMKGELEFTRLLRVDGRFEGDLITDKGSLVVGPKGEVVGDLKNMQEVYVEGIVRGNVFANDVKVKNDGMLFGDIQCFYLTLDPTASIKGVADTATLKERALLEANPAPPSSSSSATHAAASAAAPIAPATNAAAATAIAPAPLAPAPAAPTPTGSPPRAPVPTPAAATTDLYAAKPPVAPVATVASPQAVPQAAPAPASPPAAVVAAQALAASSPLSGVGGGEGETSAVLAGLGDLAVGDEFVDAAGATSPEPRILKDGLGAEEGGMISPNELLPSPSS